MFQIIIRNVYRNFRMTSNLTTEIYHPLKIRLIISRNIKESSCDHSVQNVCAECLNPILYTTPKYDHPPSPTFCLFFPSPPLLATLFLQYRPNEISGKHSNKLIAQSYFFIFRGLKNNVTCFFYKQYLYKQHQAKICSKIIIV